jgi:hypothetical protein
MFTKDTNQRVRPPGQGQAINASDLRKILALILQCVKGGRGIQVQRVGQSVIVSQQAGTRGGGGGGGQVIWYTATTKAGLPDAADGIISTALGRVTAGAQQGMCCVRHPTTDDWVSFTHLE